MAKQDINKEMLLMQAKRLHQYCDLLIQQCDNWLDVPVKKATRRKLFGDWKPFKNRLFGKKDETLNQTKP